MEMGLSERRAAWLCGWMASLEDRKEVSDLEFAAGLGRLSFAALALPSERPLLGPLVVGSAWVEGPLEDSMGGIGGVEVDQKKDGVWDEDGEGPETATRGEEGLQDMD